VAKTKRELEPAFRTALRTFLERYPGHSANAEARFRQAELLRDAGDVTAAVQEFRRVKGNPTLEFYAEFNAAQAMFTRLHEPPPNVRPEQLEQERRDTVERLASLVKRLEKHRGGAVPVEELGAKTSLMAAILATEGKAPDYKKALDLTANFAKRFPGRPELARQAFALEILALLHVADPKRAEQALTGYLEAFGGAEKDRKKLLKRLGREFYAQSEAQRADKRIELANASARVAIEIYERLRVALEADAASLHALRGIQAMLGELYAEIGEDPQAAEEYARLLQIDSASPEALRGLAEIAARAGNHAKSSEYWSALAKTMDRKDPEWLDARYAAAREARAAGNAGSACHVVQETRELSPYPLIGGHKVRFGELERQVCAG
jgi:TolA-binding protein